MEVAMVMDRTATVRIQVAVAVAVEIEMQTINNANEPVDLIPVPSGLTAWFLLIQLRGQEPCRKQAGIGHWGR